MSNIKTAIVSSITTFILVSITFAVFFAKSGSGTFSNGSESTATLNGQFVNSSSNVENKDSLNQNLYELRHTIITKTVKKVSPAVVGINVSATRRYRPIDPLWRFFYGDAYYVQPIQSVGSGTIISPDGYILTNDHVAGSADEILITLTDGEQYKAKKIGSDLTTDICLLKIEGTNLPYIEFGDSRDLMIGEWTIAIGNPFGLFSMTDNPTVTLGVISALGMNLNALEGRYYMNMIQTDASINQGNSGGPLVNAVGQMIGMNTIIYTAEGSSGNVGVGFAIPITKIKKVVDELKRNGSFNRNYWTGLRIQDIDQDIAKYFELSRARGVLVREVEKNSPAESAEIKEYDIIIQLDGLRVDNTDVLQGLLKDYKAGETLNFTILREGKKLNKNMILEKR